MVDFLRFTTDFTKPCISIVFFTFIFLPKRNVTGITTEHQCACGNNSNMCKKKSAQYCKLTILHLKIY